MTTFTNVPSSDANSSGFRVSREISCENCKLIFFRVQPASWHSLQKLFFSFRWKILFIWLLTFSLLKFISFSCFYRMKDYCVWIVVVKLCNSVEPCCKLSCQVSQFCRANPDIWYISLLSTYFLEFLLAWSLHLQSVVILSNS